MVGEEAHKPSCVGPVGPSGVLASFRPDPKFDELIVRCRTRVVLDGGRSMIDDNYLVGDLHGVNSKITTVIK